MTIIIKIKTCKGKEGIQVNTFQYRKDKTLVSGEIVWRCVKYKCSASLKTNNAVTSLKSKPMPHSHDPPETPSSPYSSEPSTPSLPNTPLHLPYSPRRDLCEAASETPRPSLTELLSPYTTITPEPPTFSQLDEENAYLRQRVAELVYTNKALTDRLITAETQIMELKNGAARVTTTSTASQTEVFKRKQTNTTSESSTQTEEQQFIETQLQTKTFPSFPVEGIHVWEADMGDVIDAQKYNPYVAFAHSISGDFHHHRQMSAGVAVSFKMRFGKPQANDCLTESLAFQKSAEGASVYSLVTKSNFNGKPKKDEYDLAFHDLMNDFTNRELTTLVCSPMGCVRDRITIDHFAAKIQEFHQTTGATVIIITKDERSKRILRNGLPHYEFVRQLKEKIKNNMNSTNWYQLSDDDMRVYMDKLKVPVNTLVLEPAVSHLIKENKTTEEVKKLLQDLDLVTYDYVLAPINDRRDDNREGGTHWSLLMYTRSTDTYYHLDSLEPLNTKHAERMAARLSGDPKVNVVQLRCARQEKNVECGAYVLHFIELICFRIKKHLSLQDDRCYVHNFSINNIYDSIGQRTKNTQSKQNVVSLKTVSHKQKITLMSDSHGRSLGRMLQTSLGRNYEVLSVVKPNATLENVTGGLDCEISGLKNSDHLVIIGGTNDINDTNEFDIRHYVNRIAHKTKHTNVILCTIPLRYDKPYLNKKIRKINIDLVIESLKYEHIKILSLSNIPINNYTTRGIHLNYKGKQCLSKRVTEKINSPNLN